MIKTILVVEDDSTISSSLKELLEDNGYAVLTAFNGSEALDILKKITAPSLIILDLMMPIMDGFEFRENQLSNPLIKDIPVIIMSADGHIEEKRERARTAYYLKKPLDIFHLLAVIEKLTV